MAAALTLGSFEAFPGGEAGFLMTQHDAESTHFHCSGHLQAIFFKKRGKGQIKLVGDTMFTSGAIKE